MGSGEADCLQVEHYRRNHQQGAVETVEHAAVTRKDVARVLVALLTFLERLHQVATYAEDHDGQCKAYPLCRREEGEEVCHDQ